MFWFKPDPPCHGFSVDVCWCLFVEFAQVLLASILFSYLLHTHLIMCSCGWCCHGDVILWWHQHVLALWLLLSAGWAWVFARPACALIGPYPLGSLYLILIIQYWIPWVSSEMGLVRPHWAINTEPHPHSGCVAVKETSLQYIKLAGMAGWIRIRVKVLVTLYKWYRTSDIGI